VGEREREIANKIERVREKKKGAFSLLLVLYLVQMKRQRLVMSLSFPEGNSNSKFKVSKCGETMGHSVYCSENGTVTGNNTVKMLIDNLTVHPSLSFLFL
jgi:hypothetical protein